MTEKASGQPPDREDSPDRRDTDPDMEVLADGERTAAESTTHDRAGTRPGPVDGDDGVVIYRAEYSGGSAGGLATGIVLLVVMALAASAGIALFVVAAGLAMILFPLTLGLIGLVVLVAWLRRPRNDP